MSEKTSVQRWTQSDVPTESDLKKLMAAEGVQLYRWTNGPGDTYAAHTHTYHKIIYVVDGSITFKLVEEGEDLELNIGDRMDLPAGIVHAAVVGDLGVVCLEGHK